MRYALTDYDKVERANLPHNRSEASATAGQLLCDWGLVIV